MATVAVTPGKKPVADGASGEESKPVAMVTPMQDNVVGVAGDSGEGVKEGGDEEVAMETNQAGKSESATQSADSAQLQTTPPEPEAPPTANEVPPADLPTHETPPTAPEATPTNEAPTAAIQTTPPPDEPPPEATPTNSEAPPNNTGNKPDTTEQATPTTDEATPTTDEAPPTTDEATPTTDEALPTTDEAPPTSSRPETSEEVTEPVADIEKEGEREEKYEAQKPVEQVSCEVGEIGEGVKDGEGEGEGVKSETGDRVEEGETKDVPVNEDTQQQQQQQQGDGEVSKDAPANEDTSNKVEDKSKYYTLCVCVCVIIQFLSFQWTLMRHLKPYKCRRMHELKPYNNQLLRHRTHLGVWPESSNHGNYQTLASFKHAHTHTHHTHRFSYILLQHTSCILAIILWISYL